MSITYDASAGKGDKRINITVFDVDGTRSANASCTLSLFENGTIVAGNTFTVGNGGNAGVFVPGTITTAMTTCNNSSGDTGTETVTLTKHTTKLHVQLA